MYFNLIAAVIGSYKRGAGCCQSWSSVSRQQRSASNLNTRRTRGEHATHVCQHLLMSSVASFELSYIFCQKINWSWTNPDRGQSSSDLHTYIKLKESAVVISVYLQVGYSHSCDHSEHNEEHPSDDRLWNGNENGSEFSKDSQNQHENSSHLEDQSAAHLP